LGIPNKKNAPIGKYTAAVLFIVDKDGYVSDVKPATNLGYGMEEEVVRVILTSGKWTPALQNGTPVRAYRKQPVTFLLDTDVFTISTKLPYTLVTNMDNEITVMAKKVKAEDIGINVPGDKVIWVSDGKFSVRVSNPGRVTIEIVNSKKDDKEIGIASFEVKTN